MVSQATVFIPRTPRSTSAPHNRQQIHTRCFSECKEAPWDSRNCCTCVKPSTSCAEQARQVGEAHTSDWRFTPSFQLELLEKLLLLSVGPLALDEPQLLGRTIRIHEMEW